MEENKNVEILEEHKLAQQLKQICSKHSNGSFQENDPAKGGEILYKIGLIYRQKSPDKIALIKSVGLLNAAITRNPINVSQIKTDLADLCKHILVEAKAKIPDVNLIAKANKVKKSINKWRQEISNDLNSAFAGQGELGGNQVFVDDENTQIQIQKTNKVSFIKQLNIKIASKYKTIMADLSRFCEEVMEKPPCEYAIVGMGSLARNEITPYSDFEHIIILSNLVNYELHLKYFRWYSVIFHTIILNLQETIIPSLNIKSPNDEYSSLDDWYFDAHTQRGISFDGMMIHACKFPLGRTETNKNKSFKIELIKPVNEMLNFLSFEEDLKNGYHLADILTRTCFVFGNKKIFDCFQQGVEKYLNNKSKLEKIEEVKKQVNEDLERFSARFCLVKLKACDTINIKQLIYRSCTVFITALARIHDISENSCFDIISKMAIYEKITNTTKNKLLYAIAIACETRLRIYLKYKSQKDVVHLNPSSKISEKFLNIVGAESTLNYFQIAYCLQCEVAKQLCFTKFYFYSNPQLFNFTLSLAFGINGVITNFTKENLSILWNPKSFNFDNSVYQLETCNIHNYKTDINNKALDENQLYDLSNQLYTANLHDEALELWKVYLEYYKNNNSLEQQSDREIASILNNIGNCLESMQQYDDALSHYKQSLEIKKINSLDEQNDRDIASTLNNIGSCWRVCNNMTMH